MSGIELKRILRAVFFLFIVICILFTGMLPYDFDGDNFQASPYLFAWTAAFIVRRPGSVGIIVIVLAGIFYAVYNDEGIALGSLTYLLFSLIIHETRGDLEHQSFVMETGVIAILFLLSQLFKNLILQLFYTHTIPTLFVLRYTLYFILSYIVFATLITLVFGRRSSKQISTKS